MSPPVTGRAGRLIQLCRFAVQTAALTVTVAGSYAAIRGMGIPKWAFFAIVILTGLFFCGWMCPFGTVQEWLRHVGKGATGLGLAIPGRIGRYLQFSRYVLLLAMAALAVDFYDPRNAFSGYFSGGVGETAVYVAMGVFFLLSLFTDRPFCRYFCGFGAQYGLMSVLRVFAVKRDRNACVGCGKCDTTCIMGIRVSSANTVRHPHCINCFKCVSSCPITGALGTGFAFPRVSDARALTGSPARPGQGTNGSPPQDDNGQTSATGE